VDEAMSALRRLRPPVLAGALALPLIVVALGGVSRAWSFPDALPAVDLEGFAETTTAPATIDALLDGLLVSVATTVTAVALAWPAARLLARSSRWWAGAGLLVLLLPSVVPAVCVAIGVSVVLLRTDAVGLFGPHAAVVIAHLVPALPYAVGVLMAAFVRFDDRIEQQAAVLGASPRTVHWRVTVPMLAPAVVSAAVLTFAVSWAQYLLTLLAGGGRVVTITMLLATAVSGGNPTTIGSVALLALAPAALAVIALTLPRRDVWA
jgi:putative spermidine/putrescine transport system permease protein